MSLKVCVFNSPPRGGKGVAASHMKQVINNQEGNLSDFHMEFKDELFKLTANFLGITVDEFLDGYDEKVVDFFNSGSIGMNYAFMEDGITEDSWLKDLPMYEFPDGVRRSKREALIYVSENVIKPSFGEDAFGKALVAQLPENGIVFVSDSGFPEELQPVIDHVGVENVLVVRIQREGCTFEGDSRSYLDPDMFEQDVKFLQILNNGTEDEFKSEVEEGVGAWMNENL
ncbi:deoxynucleoside monophosphate kinase [Vibrio phage K406]